MQKFKVRSKANLHLSRVCFLSNLFLWVFVFSCFPVSCSIGVPRQGAHDKRRLLDWMARRGLPDGEESSNKKNREAALMVEHKRNKETHKTAARKHCLVGRLLVSSFAGDNP